MVNLRAHDPYSGHATTSPGTDTNDGDTSDPIQPATPGEHPPPPVTQPPVENPDRGDTSGDGLEDLRKDDLIDLAEDVGAPTYGTKADLITRIRRARETGTA
jgi:hypothetical protein